MVIDFKFSVKVTIKTHSKKTTFQIPKKKKILFRKKNEISISMRKN